MSIIPKIIREEKFTLETLIDLLMAKGDDIQILYREAALVKLKYIGRKVSMRGLIELSNKCAKDCYYCGIRKSNTFCSRYTLSVEEVVETAVFAYKSGIGSLAIQSGELSNSVFIQYISEILTRIKTETQGKLGVTLSCGEQSEETYKEWYDKGAHRYLLRIEASNPKLYQKIHPNDKLHNHQDRIDALYRLKKSGYQVGTGVMIGLPFQTYEDLANDLLFMQEMDIDMCGMGPYLEHESTPLFDFKDQLMCKNDRYQLSLKMIAILRILMKDINIAATTALQAIHPNGRMEALKIGANVLMPNISPGSSREFYALYQNKPGMKDSPADSLEKITSSLDSIDHFFVKNDWGDSRHFFNR